MDLIMTSYEIKNPELKKATTQIKTCAVNIRKNFLRIADKLAEIDESQCYVEDGFGDVIEYAKSVFNMKKTTAYNLLRIGHEYVDIDDHGKTILASDKGDYSVSQLAILLPAGVDRVTELNRDGVISPDMSVKKLKAIISKDDETEGDSEDEGESEDAPENEPSQIITLWINGDISFSGFDNCNEEQLNKLAEEIEKVVNKYL
jgi:hypothetical protein